MKSLLQVVEFNKQLKDDIMVLENECASVCKKLEAEYADDFQNLGVKVLLECVRTVKGKVTNQNDILEDFYESYVEIGIEKEEEYYPNAYIPIWRCKKEMFQDIGYLTKYDAARMEGKIRCILEEMLQEKLEEIE